MDEITSSSESNHSKDMKPVVAPINSSPNVSIDEDEALIIVTGSADCNAPSLPSVLSKEELLQQDVDAESTSQKNCLIPDKKLVITSIVVGILMVLCVLVLTGVLQKASEEYLRTGRTRFRKLCSFFVKLPSLRSLRSEKMVIIDQSGAYGSTARLDLTAVKKAFEKGEVQFLDGTAPHGKLPVLSVDIIHHKLCLYMKDAYGPREFMCDMVIADLQSLNDQSILFKTSNVTLLCHERGASFKEWSTIGICLSFQAC